MDCPHKHCYCIPGPVVGTVTAMKNILQLVRVQHAHFPPKLKTNSEMQKEAKILILLLIKLRDGSLVLKLKG